MALVHDVSIKVDMKYLCTDNYIESFKQLEEAIKEALTKVTDEDFTINVDCGYIED